jgi:hypothetical protein
MRAPLGAYRVITIHNPQPRRVVALLISVFTPKRDHSERMLMIRVAFVEGNVEDEVVGGGGFREDEGALGIFEILRARMFGEDEGALGIFEILRSRVFREDEGALVVCSIT